MRPLRVTISFSQKRRGADLRADMPNGMAMRRPQRSAHAFILRLMLACAVALIAAQNAAVAAESSARLS
jgi:hypothetical protein